MRWGGVTISCGLGSAITSRVSDKKKKRCGKKSVGLTGLANPANEWNLRMPCSALLMTSLWRMLLITSFQTAAKVAHFCVRRSKNSRTNSRGWLFWRLAPFREPPPAAAAFREKEKKIVSDTYPDPKSCQED